VRDTEVTMTLTMLVMHSKVLEKQTVRKCDAAT